MPTNLFAACRAGSTLLAKRIRLNGEVQDEVERLFLDQEEDFRDGIANEIPFDERWQPSPDEFLTLQVDAIASEIAELRRALAANLTSVDPIDTASFMSEGIKAVFVSPDDGGENRILVQRFISSQVLSRRFALVEAGNTFRRLNTTAFSLGGTLTCIVEDDTIKFRRFTNLRSVFNLREAFQAATEPEVRAFATHHNLEIGNVDQFVNVTDEVSRRLIHAITESRILDQHSATAIQAAAASTQLQIQVQNSIIVVPDNRREIKSLLEFLDESRYLGPLSGVPYITNSRRRA